MSDKAKISAKSSEAKKSNTASQTQKTASFQSTGSPYDHILFLQRTIGNQAVGRLLKGTGFRGQGIGLGVQAKLRIGQPNDVYEQEADRVADTVMRMDEGKGHGAWGIGMTENTAVSSQNRDESVQRKPG